MHAIRKRLTYANVVASLALFLALGGATAIAANQLGKNSVGPKQLKKNAVTSAKVKKNAITAAKIKKGAVTGAKVNLATLGTVPSASTANSANTAASAATAANLNGYQRKFLRLAATPVADYEAGVDSAPETVMFSSGPISVVAKCFKYSTSVYAMFQIRSSVAGAAFWSEYEYTYGDNFLNPSSDGNDRVLYYESTGSDSAYYEAEEGEFSAVAPGDLAVMGDLAVGVKSGTLPGGNNGVYGPGDVCLMSGQMSTIS